MRDRRRICEHAYRATARPVPRISSEFSPFGACPDQGAKATVALFPIDGAQWKECIILAELAPENLEIAQRILAREVSIAALCRQRVQPIEPVGRDIAAVPKAHDIRPLGLDVAERRVEGTTAIHANAADRRDVVDAELRRRDFDQPYPRDCQMPSKLTARAL